MKTLAAVLYKLNSPLVLEELEIPQLKKGQLLVQVKASGICRSQINEIKGLKGEDKFLPHLLGHEGAGIVVETGEGVKKVKKSDEVILTWIKGKGLEGVGTKYSGGKGMVNSGPIATFSQYAVVSENRLVKIPKDIPFQLAALLGCAVPTGAGIVLNTLKDYQGESLAVFGCGGVGGAVIMGAKMRNIKTIIAVDINQKALDYANTLGATHKVFFEEETIIEKVHQICPMGTDFAVEATGNKTAMEKAIEAVKDDGKVVIAGNIQKGEKIYFDPFDLIKGKRLLGTWGGEADPDNDIPKYIQAYQNQTLELGKMIGGTFQFDQINDALKELEEHRSFGRIMIKFEK